ncbi:MAG: AAA family ATPase [Candidatus Heimdallarchaeota archaeon]|nr:MAG: AAA family ATPase [Candidatus Heimdallarchaeota archaeon]
MATRLAELLFLEYLELNTLVLEKGFYLGYDINRDSVIIDDELLVSSIESIIKRKKRLCLDGGVVPLDSTFNFIIVLRCHVDTLRGRLLSRGYPEEKIEANIEAEIMNIAYHDAIELIPSHNIVEVFNDEFSVDETCNQIISIISQHHPSVLKGFIN